MVIRKATREDIPLILEFIKELAEYEKMLDQVVATEALLEYWLFEKQVAETLFVMEGKKEVGFALYFYNFSTFLGRAGIHIEDVFVKPEYRGRGYGKGLFKEIARMAKRNWCGRVEWSCLNWNEPSIEFYYGLGAESLDEWTEFRLTGEALDKLAE